MATHDIQLRGKQRPQFPDLCVGCEKEHPQHTTEIVVTGSQATLGWTLDTALLATGTAIQGTNMRVRVRVPACPACAAALDRRHFWKTILLYASGLTGAAAALAIIVLGARWGLSSGVTVFLGLLGLLAFICAPVIWELLDPPAFTITPSNGEVTYEFRSEKCANIFRALNPRTADPAAPPAAAAANAKPQT